MASNPIDQTHIDEQAQRIRLSREAAMLTELVAELNPYTGEWPQTLEQYRALPAAHRRQLAQLQPQHVAALTQVAELLDQATQQDLRKQQRQEELAGLPVDSPESFAALSAQERAHLAMTLTRRQRLALLGELPQEEGGFL